MFKRIKKYLEEGSVLSYSLLLVVPGAVVFASACVGLYVISSGIFFFVALFSGLWTVAFIMLPLIVRAVEGESLFRRKPEPPVAWLRIFKPAGEGELVFPPPCRQELPGAHHFEEGIAAGIDPPQGRCLHIGLTKGLEENIR